MAYDEHIFDRIDDMVEDMKEKGFAYVDQGALVVDVKEENDTKEIPPCMLLKSDGASLYTTTDLATIVERMKLFHPDEILYVVDKRQEQSPHQRGAEQFGQLLHIIPPVFVCLWTGRRLLYDNQPIAVPPHIPIFMLISEL